MIMHDDSLIKIGEYKVFDSLVRGSKLIGHVLFKNGKYQVAINGKFVDLTGEQINKIMNGDV